MELALMAITISIVVLVVQVVSLVLITGMRKSLKNLKEVRPLPSAVPSDRFEKRNPDFRRHEKRPYQDQRPQQPAAVTPIDPVEKSLRDINLRLKSAERDQEFARRKIQENFSRGDRPRDRDDRDRDDRNRRGNRDRDHHRNHRRDNWQDRNRSGAPQSQQQELQPAVSTPSAQPYGEPAVEKKAFTPFTPSTPAPELQATVQAVPETGQNQGLEAADFASDENLQHGRKIIVKRRTLNDEPAEASPGSVTDAPAPSPAPPPAENLEEETRISATTTDTPPEGEIRFGRR
jgi:hypothetical protein